MFKVPIDLVRALSMMWGFSGFPDTIDRWTHQKHTPPYISSRPSVKHFSFKKGDILVICSDGLRTSLTARKECPTKTSGIRLYLSLALDSLDVQALLSYEKTFGHSFIPSADIINITDGMFWNVLFGLDDHRMTKETMATMINYWVWLG